MIEPSKEAMEAAIELVHRNVTCSWLFYPLGIRKADFCDCSTHANARNEIARAIDKARREALEQAAKRCEAHAGFYPHGLVPSIAAAIRALIEEAK
jgi:hypothetical protein